MIEGGLLFILAGAPLAFGSVHAFAYGAVQSAALFIFLLWGVHQYLIPETQNGNLIARYRFVLPFIFWIGLVLFQMIPLAPELLRIVSPETFRIHQAILATVHRGSYPLSLSVFDTWRALLQVVTCVVLFYLVLSFSPFPVASDKTDKKGDPFFNSLLFVAALTVGFQVFYALTEYFLGHQQIFLFHRSTPARGAAGTFVSPNHFANYLLLFFPLFFSWAVLLRRSSTQQHEDGIPSFRGLRGFLMVVLVGMAIAVVLSHSRMAFFTFLIEVFLLSVCFFFSEAHQRRWTIGLLFSLFVGAVIALIFLDPGFSFFQNKLLTLFQGKEKAHLRFWKDSFQIVKDFPWTGTGLGTFQLILPKYSSVPIVFHLEHAHNDWLELLVETGIPGFGLMATAILWFFAASLRRLQGVPLPMRPLGFGILISLLAFMIHSLTEFNFHIPANTYSFAILLGMSLRLNQGMGGEP